METTTPRCPDCATPLIIWEGERICPQCDRYEPTIEPLSQDEPAEPPADE
jgi:uncharacterized Zn finger protein (UPF0148 family)